MFASLIDPTGLRCPNNVDAHHDASVNLRPAFRALGLLLGYQIFLE